MELIDRTEDSIAIRMSRKDYATIRIILDAVSEDYFDNIEEVLCNVHELSSDDLESLYWRFVGVDP